MQHVTHRVQDAREQEEKDHEEAHGESKTAFPARA
jgi:hypothetical protein